MSTIGSVMGSNSLPLPESAGSTHSSSRPGQAQVATNVAQDFESVFASMMLKEMRQTLEPGTMFGSDSGDVYGGLFDRFLGEQMTKGTGLGMAGMVQKSIERMQQAAVNKPVTPATGTNAVTPIAQDK